MSAGSILLVAALLSLSGLGICHKVADFKGCRPSAVSVMLFFGAAGVLWSYTLFKVLGASHLGLFPPFTLSAVGVAALCGTCCGLAILTFQVGIRYGRISTSWLVINLSTIVPTVLSLILYKEWKPGWQQIVGVGSNAGWQQVVEVAWKAWGRQIVGLVLVFSSVILLWRDKAVETVRAESPASGFPILEAEPAMPAVDAEAGVATQEEA